MSLIHHDHRVVANLIEKLTVVFVVGAHKLADLGIGHHVREPEAVLTQERFPHALLKSRRADY